MGLPGSTWVYLGLLGISLGYLGDILGISWGYLGDIFGPFSVGPLEHWSIGSLVHWSIGPLVCWSIGPLVKCQMLNVIKVKLLSERTSGVSPVIFFLLSPPPQSTFSLNET